MNTALKNRLVGTFILVALAVIFLPEYLDGKKRVREDIKVVIPPTPEVELQSRNLSLSSAEVIEKATFKPEVQNQSALDLDSESQSDKVAPNSGEPQSNLAQKSDNNAEPKPSSEVEVARSTIQSPETVEVDESLAQQTLLTKTKQEGAGWVVQLGSFKHQKNVRELVRKVEKAGYRTYTRPIQTPSGKLTKVFVGPEINQSKLNEALPHLKEITGLTGRITPFEIK
ncbi:MAG: SPOR domain-containing protein [Alteromonadaceae bacterium]|nr:SPOR domain-containing protein [Alteromonadaceae bacterium]